MLGYHAMMWEGVLRSSSRPLASYQGDALREQVPPHLQLSMQAQDPRVTGVPWASSIQGKAGSSSSLHMACHSLSAPCPLTKPPGLLAGDRNAIRLNRKALRHDRQPGRHNRDEGRLHVEAPAPYQLPSAA